MPYYAYKKLGEGDKTRFALYTENIYLWGCRQGLIPSMLQRRTATNQREPYAWHFTSQYEALADLGWEYAQANSIAIDMKPKDAGVHLCELLDCFGYSWKDWTPILLRMRVLIWAR
jgi:hypothetical protein